MRHDWVGSNGHRTLSCPKCGSWFHRKVLQPELDPALDDTGFGRRLEDADEARERAGIPEDCEETMVRQVMES